MEKILLQIFHQTPEMIMITSPPLYGTLVFLYISQFWRQIKLKDPTLLPDYVTIQSFEQKRRNSLADRRTSENYTRRTDDGILKENN